MAGTRPQALPSDKPLFGMGTVLPKMGPRNELPCLGGGVLGGRVVPLSGSPGLVPAWRPFLLGPEDCLVPPSLLGGCLGQKVGRDLSTDLGVLTAGAPLVPSAGGNSCLGPGPLSSPLLSIPHPPGEPAPVSRVHTVPFLVIV